MKYFFVIGLVVLIGVLLYSRVQPQQKAENTPSTQNQTALSSQTNSEGSVTVKVTPTDMSDTAWKFSIVLDTHSNELDQDLTKVFTLKDAEGNMYQSTTWEGSPPGGHHREGQLIFDPILPKPGSISLVVESIGGVAERTFLWELGGE